MPPLRSAQGRTAPRTTAIGSAVIGRVPLPIHWQSRGLGGMRPASSSHSHRFAWMPRRSKRTAALAEAMARMSDKASGDAGRAEHSGTCVTDY